jgi:hypothetical protein
MKMVYVDLLLQIYGDRKYVTKCVQSGFILISNFCIHTVENVDFIAELPSHLHLDLPGYFSI